MGYGTNNHTSVIFYSLYKDSEIGISTVFFGSHFLPVQSDVITKQPELLKGFEFLKCCMLFSLAPATTVLSDFLLDFEECWYDNRRKEPLPLETICYCTFMELHSDSKSRRTTM